MKRVQGGNKHTNDGKYIIYIHTQIKNKHKQTTKEETSNTQNKTGNKQTNT